MDFVKLLKDLPADPIDAAYALLDRVRPESDEGKNYYEPCVIIEAFYDLHDWSRVQPLEEEKHEIREILGTRIVNRDVVASSRSKWRRLFASYETDISGKKFKQDKLIAKDELASVKTPEFGYSILTKDEKIQIQNYIKEIRAIIEASALNDGKKNALFERLASLSGEVDKSGTKTDRFFAFMGDLAFVVGDMAEKAKPATDEFKKILQILMRSRSKKEGARLPKQENLPQLPSA